jgi:MFS family permease
MPYHAMLSHYHIPRMREMGIIYWCNTLGALGSSLVAIFIPIYLLRSGFSFTTVLIFLLVQQVFAGLLQYPISRLFKYFHPHFILASGSLLYAGFFGLLSVLQTEIWFLGLLAFVWALNRATYWVAFHYIFSYVRGHENASRQIAGFQALSILAATIAPAVGGIIATVFGINYSYVLAIVLLLAAAAPLLSTANEPPHATLKLSWREVWSWRRDAIANGSNGIILTAELSLWPLLVFTFASSYAKVGILSAIIAASAVLITLFVGRQRQKHDRQYIRRGLAAYSLTSIGRAAAQSTTQIFGLNMLAGIGRSLYVTPFMNRYYNNSDGDHRLGYITFMEISFMVASALFLIPLIVLSLFLGMQVVLAIGVAAVALCALGVKLILWTLIFADTVTCITNGGMHEQSSRYRRRLPQYFHKRDSQLCAKSDWCTDYTVNRLHICQGFGNGSQKSA